MSYINIDLRTDEQTMVGAEGWGEYNEKDSVAAFAAQVEQTVIAAYPGVEVNVQTWCARHGIVTDLEDTDAAVAVDAIIDRVWQSWEWLRR